MARVHLHPTVPAQIRAIDRWWRQNTGRPTLFREEWTRAKQKLRATPLIGPPVPSEGPDAHCLLLAKSKHYVYYRYDAPPLDEVVIVLVWSHHRDERPPLPR